MSVNAKQTETKRADIYERVTAAIIAQLEKGTRPWMQPWDAGQSPVRPLRHNGVACRGINTVLLWMTAAELGYQSPYWMTYSQAKELGAQVKKGEKSSLVVYAGAIEKQEDEAEGEDKTRRIPFLKGYSVFCADQIEGLPDNFYGHAILAMPRKSRTVSSTPTGSSQISKPISVRAVTRHSIARQEISSRCRLLTPLSRQWPMRPLLLMKQSIGQKPSPGLTATSAANHGVTKAMPARSWSPSWEAFSLPQTSACRSSHATITPLISNRG